MRNALRLLESTCEDQCSAVVEWLVALEEWPAETDAVLALTVLTAVFPPMSLITGIFGMKSEPLHRQTTAVSPPDPGIDAGRRFAKVKAEAGLFQSGAPMPDLLQRCGQSDMQQSKKSAQP